MAHLFDETELLERIDYDREFLNDTVEMLAEDGPALVQEIRQAALTGDAPNREPGRARAEGDDRQLLRAGAAGHCARGRTDGQGGRPGRCSDSD
jgi:hypothetical protein